MHASASELDDLLEWSPGPPDAARADILGAFRWGTGRAFHSKAVIFWLWLINLGLALVLVAPLYSLIYAHTATSSAAAQLSQGFTAVWWTDFSHAQAAALGTLPNTIWFAGAFYLMLHLLLAGGMLTFLHTDQHFPFFARFGAACGNYFGRFFRLLLIALACYWAVLWINGRLFSLVLWWSDNGALQPQAWWGHLARNIFTVVLFFTVSLVFDYAKVRTVVTDSRSMLLEAARSFRFVFGHLLRTGSLYLLLLTAGALLMALYWAGARGLGLLGAALLPLFLLQQLYLAARLWLRLATWGGAISLFKGIANEQLAASADSEDR
ncbi:MAG: hypothetical protein ACE5HV_10250 [Acidobacteriota bacterium]